MKKNKLKNKMFDNNIWHIIKNEKKRQELSINLIASENYVANEILEYKDLY